jgi:hypothetical protein
MQVEDPVEDFVLLQQLEHQEEVAQVVVVVEMQELLEQLILEEVQEQVV